MRRRRPVRGMTLIEVSIVAAIGLALTAAGGATLVGQARRSRAIEGANNALLPHGVARDRAVAARSCVESVLLPPLRQAGVTLSADLPPEVRSGRREHPRVAIIQWTACDETATVTKVDFYDLEGEISFSGYSSTDGRMVFSPTGALTDERPGSAPVGGGSLETCPIPGATGGRTGTGSRSTPDDGAGGGGRGGDGGTCKPPPRIKPPVDDITFTATTFDGQVRSFRTWSRLGATELLGS